MVDNALVPGARHAIPPAGIVATAWPRIEKTCRNIGWRFDPWQRATGRLILAKRGDGAWAADLSIMSIPRQVGKSYLLGCIIFALCLLNPGLRVIWTSHHTATTEEMYEAMKDLAGHLRVKPHVARCAALQGSRWRISFGNRSRIDFGARERGFGRGKAKVGVLVLDEFQHISMRALANLTPTTNAATNPLVLCAGTPPAPEDNGEAFTKRRTAAIEGIAAETLYVEFSADLGADLDDRAQWAKANPSFPKRTPERAFLLNRKILDDPSFKREFLGIWSSDVLPSLIPSALWCRRITETPPVIGFKVFGVKFSIDGKTVALAAARRPDEGPIHVELVAPPQATDQGLSELVEWLASPDRSDARIVIDGKDGAGDLYDRLRKAGVRPSRLIRPTVDQVITAHSGFLSAVKAGEMTHFDQGSLNESVRHAGKRAIGTAGGWGWKPLGDGDVTAVEAVTLAHWGAKTAKARTRETVYA